MQTCPQCGASSPLSATWCGQCLLAFNASPVLAYAAAGAAAQPVGSDIPVAPTAPSSALPEPSYSQPPPQSPQPDGRLLDRRAAVLVAAAIGLGGVMQLIAVELSHRTSIEPDTLIRYDLVLTLGLYAVVAAMIISQITPSIRLRWGDGRLLTRVAIGAGAGIGFSLVLMAVVSAAAGHLQTDPRIVLLMSAGDPSHIIVTALISCVAAPLVEEVLFRGLLLESLRPRGTRIAILGSAGAFAVWHFMPGSLVYYAALGAALGGLYLKRGLACSVAAHVGFNAVLTVAAISIVLGPAHLVQIGGLRLTAPSGWSVRTSLPAELSAANAILVGPSDAELDIVPGPPAGDVSPETVAARLAGGQLPVQSGLSLDTSAVRLVPTPAGQLVEVPLQADGRQGTFALLAADGQSYELVFLSAGSVKAQNDFAAMMTTLHVN